MAEDNSIDDSDDDLLKAERRPYSFSEQNFEFHGIRRGGNPYEGFDLQSNWSFKQASFSIFS